MKVCLKCSQQFPNTIKINAKRVYLNKRSYCLDCSPLGSRNRRKLHISGAPKKHLTSFRIRNCRICGTIVKTSGARCYSCRARIRRYRTKQAAVKILGGKCIKCGWSGNLVGYDFHHKENKEFNISAATNSSWETVLKELKKCELWCAICHRINHSSKRDEIFIKEALAYKGKLLGL